jgi:hypothetical protein
MISAGCRKGGKPASPLFTILFGTVCNSFAAPKKNHLGTRSRAGAFTGSHCGHKKLCSAKRKRLGDERGARTLKGAGSTPPIGKELPMEFTASVTAILTIMSFGFLAAVILGMI